MRDSSDFDAFYAAGVTGRVEARTSAVTAATNPKLAIRARDITWNPMHGTVLHRPAGLVFVASDPRGQVNRIVTDTAPAVTIGFTGGTDTQVAALKPSVDLGSVSTVTVVLLRGAYAGSGGQDSDYQKNAKGETYGTPAQPAKELRPARGKISGAAGHRRRCRVRQPRPARSVNGRSYLVQTKTSPASLDAAYRRAGAGNHET